MPRGGSRRHSEMRAEENARWRAVNVACSVCGQQTIDWDAPANTPDALEVEHTLPVVSHPHLEFDPANRRPSHHRCNRGKGAGTGPAGLGVTSETW